MSALKDAIKNVLAVKKDRDFIDAFAKRKYVEKFKDDKLQHGTWRCYRDFVILDESTILIEFAYGGGDMDFSSSFKVEIE